MRAQGEDGAHTPGRTAFLTASDGAGPADTLTLGSQPPEVRGNASVWEPRPWPLVTAAPDH